ncbi:hypothetical protein GJAV_G00195980 [Gymnothorax javanicus]|nr:hypothetical protein GJAV_G00195980 [Gymnothorax javanicus]
MGRLYQPSAQDNGEERRRSAAGWQDLRRQRSSRIINDAAEAGDLKGGRVYVGIKKKRVNEGSLSTCWRDKEIK